MGLIRDELLRRNAEREGARRELKALRTNAPDVDATEDDFKLHTKLVNGVRSKFFDGCHGVGKDIRLLDRGLDVLAEQIMVDRGLKAIDGHLNNTVRDEIVDEALKHAWDDMPREARPPEPIVVQTKIEKAIADKQAEKEALPASGEQVELIVIKCPPANGETGEEIPPTSRYQMLCAEAEKAGITREQVGEMFETINPDSSEVDHGMVEALHQLLEERVPTMNEPKLTKEEITAVIDAGIDKVLIEEVAKSRQWNEQETFFFKMQEYCSANLVPIETITENLGVELPGTVSLEELYLVAQKLIATVVKKGEEVIEEIVNDELGEQDPEQHEAEQAEVAEEQHPKQKRAPRKPPRRPGIKPNKKKATTTVSKKK